MMKLTNKSTHLVSGYGVLEMTRIILSLICFLYTIASAKPMPRQKAISAVLIKAEIDAEMERLKRMREYMTCVDEQSRFRAEIQRRSSLCDLKAIEHRQCVARVRDRQSSNTGKGALIGIGAAVLTGGASLLFTGAGALIGHQVSDEAPNECGPVPNCDGAFIAANVTRETGMQRHECMPPEQGHLQRQDGPK